LHIRQKLTIAAAALGLTAALASPAAAQDVANPLGTTFNGGNQGTWTLSVGTQLRVDCATVVLDGTPAPAGVGVNPNVIGGPSTRMAEFWPTFGNCTMTLSGVTTPAQVGVRCNWALAIDSFNAVNGTSRQRLAFSPTCDTPTALRLTNGTCAIDVPPQVLVHNGVNVNLGGQNIPVPPSPPTGMLVNMNVNQGITRTVSAGCAPVGNPAPLASMVGTFRFNGIWAGP
jgi:hypothetical protein